MQTLIILARNSKKDRRKIDAFCAGFPSAFGSYVSRYGENIKSILIAASLRQAPQSCRVTLSLNSFEAQSCSGHIVCCGAGLRGADQTIGQLPGRASVIRAQ